MHSDTIPTGFPELDTLLGGLRRGEMVIVAGRPGMGKTGFALSMVVNAAVHAQAPVPAAIFSLELSERQLIDRIVCGEAGVDLADLDDGTAGGDELSALERARGLLASASLGIDDTPGTRVDELRAKVETLRERHATGLVLVDYLQLVYGAPDAQGRDLEIAQISGALKAMARELDVAVLVLSQIAVPLEARDDRRPVLADLHPSAVEQDADIVLFVYRDSHDKPDGDDTTAEIIVAKNDRGPTGTVKLPFRRRSTWFPGTA